MKEWRGEWWEQRNTYVTIMKSGMVAGARLQNAMGSNPEHIMALPPDSIGAKRLRIMPPT